jgi:cell division protein FtsN
MAALMFLLAGCGGGEDDEFVEQPKPRYMVPGQASDSTAADSPEGNLEESSYQAGTLSGNDGVTEEVDTQAAAGDDREAEIKATVSPSKAAPVTTSSRPEVSTSAVSGAEVYSLQLGSFTNLANARQQADRIRALGYSPVMEETVLAGQTYHRVMLKSVGDMAEASRLGEHIHSELDIAYLVRRAK